jgi:DNA-binding NarL/FixJ family response regulator
MRCVVAGWINRCPALEVCGMATGPVQALRAVRRLRPDMVVSEILRPHDLGFIRELHQWCPRLPILIFSILDEVEYGAQAREAGAVGYVMKEAGGDELVRSIRSVLRRRRDHPAGTPTRVSIQPPSAGRFANWPAPPQQLPEVMRPSAEMPSAAP